MKRHLPHQVTVFLAPLSPFTEFGWKKNKWNDHDCPTFLHVLQYSRSVQGSCFCCAPWTIACIPQPLSTTIATNFMFVTICISFLWTISSSFVNPLHQAKAWTPPTFPSRQVHWVHHHKPGHLHIFHLQQVLVLLFSILSSKVVYKLPNLFSFIFHQTAKCS